MAGPGECRPVHRLAYVLPTVYLVVVFTAFQVISLSTNGRDVTGQFSHAASFVYILTLPWSVLSPSLKGSLYYLPMVAGAVLNAGIVYFLLRRLRR